MFASAGRLRCRNKCVPRSRNYNVATQPRGNTSHAFTSRTTRDGKPLGEQHSTDSGLSGKQIAVKDNIATATLPTTASSGILSTYTSPYDATVVDLLLQNGAEIVGKTSLDEFGMGSHSQTAYHGEVVSPLTRDGVALSPGGSSGGSAVAVLDGQCWAALGTDTGGSVRLPAAYTGTVGFKPSYGLLSRWGVIAYANSLDTVGVLASKVGDVRKVYELLDRHDPKDPTALPESVRMRAREQVDERPGQRAKRLRIGVPEEYNVTQLAHEVRSAWVELLFSLQKAGHIVHSVSLPTTRQALSAYYVLAPAEASSNLAKYDGIRYGTRTSDPDASPKNNLPLYAQTRGEGFGDEVKRRILLGAYTLSSEAIDNYFIQAQKVRRLVQEDFDRVFDFPHPLLRSEAARASASAGVDILITPTAPTLPPTVEEVEKQTPVERYMNDVFTVPASLAGLPAISVPWSTPTNLKRSDELGSIGMQVIGQFADDGLVLEAAEMIEKLQTG